VGALIASPMAAWLGRKPPMLFAAVLFAYEESESQLIRNMKSIGIDLGRWKAKGLLEIHASRPTLHGLEQHLVAMYEIVKASKPDAVVIDPISNLVMSQADSSLQATLIRLIDFLKQQGVTSLFTTLTHGPTTEVFDSSGVGVSSLMDSWIVMANLEFNGERTRTLQVVKSRGMPHSNQVREFLLGDQGVELVDVFVSDQRVLTGSARKLREAQEGRG
jgi:circadian clock protein KaiC